MYHNISTKVIQTLSTKRLYSLSLEIARANAGTQASLGVMYIARAKLSRLPRFLSIT